MSSLDDNEIWRQIPPEEKFEIMARAQSEGVLTALIVIIVFSTLAVGFKLDWLMWGSLVAAPLIFQLAAGKAWRHLRPKLMLEHLAVRAVARRYAFTAKSNNLTLNLVFRGTWSEIYSEEKMQEQLQATFDRTHKAEVWIALFQDTIVVLTEGNGGARLLFANLVNDQLRIESKSLDGKGDYSSSKELTITRQEKNGVERKFSLTSKYPAALIVFEKRLLSLQREYIKHKESVLALPLSESAAPELAFEMFAE